MLLLMFLKNNANTRLEKIQKYVASRGSFLLKGGGGGLIENLKKILSCLLLKSSFFPELSYEISLFYGMYQLIIFNYIF